ncbi:MAG TPA: YihY/virulence factor BrkB family protein [Candidatus Brocadiia bacterium]|nr:YihY/virulence factor BrkB family protein [Candidatus Brocadiales bacterium]
MKYNANKFIQFLKADVWRIRANKLSRARAFWLKQLRIILLAMRGFGKDKCQLRASALTFYSLLSFVPIVAMAFGVAKGFGFEKLLEKQLYEKLPGQEEAVERIVSFARSYLENAQGGVIAGIGIAFLFLMAVNILSNIESSFNDIWGVKKARSIGRKFSDYLSIMLVCPILLIMSSSITVLIKSQVTLFTQKITLLGIFSPVIFKLVELLPYCFIWISFTFFYIFMPNTKVNFRSGLTGGIIAGTIYQVAQWGYITFQIGVSSFGAIYGSFAALPLFLFWLQVSWLIVLFGAEISFAEQNVETYEFEPDCLEVSYSFKRLLALRITHLCVKNFCNSHKPWTEDTIASFLETPIRLVRQLLFELTQSGVLSEVKLNDSVTVAYQPAHDVSELTIEKVINALEQRGIDNIPVAESDEMVKLSKHLNEFNKTLERSPANLILKDI